MRSASGAVVSCKLEFSLLMCCEGCLMSWWMVEETSELGRLLERYLRRVLGPEAPWSGKGTCLTGWSEEWLMRELWMHITNWSLLSDDGLMQNMASNSQGNVIRFWQFFKMASFNSF